MPQRTDIFDLGRLGLSSGEGRRLELHTGLGPFHYGGQRYAVEPELIPVRLDVSRTTASGWALRLRFGVGLSGPCMRCLEPAQLSLEVDAREVHQPGGGDQLTSPYIDAGEELDLSGWARDALALELPAQLTCREECLGLCGQCGANLNEDPGHSHEAAPSARWAKLSELKFD
ncbi:MAG: hypothetical protein QOK21_4133 [Solirubrobacteraceae bacterium]|jgi:uncharacterized protein|nr:hypothetical protein [Solirubrobacteraceae bacterium]